MANVRPVFIVALVVAVIIFFFVRSKMPQTIVELFEGFRATAYPDGKGLSIGFGHQILPGEEHLRTAKITLTDARKILADDLAKRYIPEVDNVIKGLGFSAKERAALISFHYNTGAIRRIAPVLATKNRAAIASKMKEYNIYKNAVNAGLVKRRAKEAEAFA